MRALPRPRTLRLATALAIAACLSAPAALATDAQSPYRPHQTRDIKALSPENRADLLAGRGMGYALPAELNSYPGPRHALDLADEIDLTPEQRARISLLFDEMQARAAALGITIVAEESALDRMFASGVARDEHVKAVSARLGSLYGTLRYVHLRYHISVRNLLSEHQIARYDAVRGYAATPPAGGGGHGGHHHGR